ncbi:MAG: cation diffusion facilitator family transporter [Proteobacteria bacterium]|nr:cation diffusion facilitator family transporter [Pseudomonadota bacterium]MDA1064415.1 cation diffusion facilitator family transporter [Pseudomonadota bacterium]
MSHGHRHGHSHDHGNSNMQRVVIALLLTGTFMIVEVIGGILSGSLALLADAGHMLTDTMALGLAATAFQISKRPPDVKRTYGYQRFQILAAFVNGLALLLIVGWILFEAVNRLRDPAPVLGTTMLLIAAIGLLVNVIAFVVLRGGDRENLNIRGAAMHVVGDLLGSLAAVIAAIVIIYTDWTPIDPILSVFVALLILRSAWALVKHSAHVLLEGAPESLNVAAMQDRLIAAVPTVRSIHHVHVWGLTPQDLLLTMHVRLTSSPGNPTECIRKIKAVLQAEYGIGHSTIEIETDDCADH